MLPVREIESTSASKRDLTLAKSFADHGAQLFVGNPPIFNRLVSMETRDVTRQVGERFANTCVRGALRLEWREGFRARWP